MTLAQHGKMKGLAEIYTNFKDKSSHAAGAKALENSSSKLTYGKLLHKNAPDEAHHSQDQHHTAQDATASMRRDSRPSSNYLLHRGAGSLTGFTREKAHLEPSGSGGLANARLLRADESSSSMAAKQDRADALKIESSQMQLK